MDLRELLDTAARQSASLDARDHRPWPLPEGTWSSAQTWVDLAFLHWRVDAAALRPLVPEQLEVDTFEGRAYVGIVPFLLTGLRLRGLLPLPGVSTFPELNVRTYVSDGQRPGIWFFSLDAGSTLFVEAAKRLYRLPYERAQMRYERIGGFVHYESARPGAAFSGRYRGEGELHRPEPGSLDAFLTERYRLYTADGGRVYRADIHHGPWQLQRGSAVVDLNTLAPVALPDEEPLVHFSPRQDAVVWPLETL